MEVMTTFIREHSPAREEPASGDPTHARVQADIQDALSVIRRRDPRRDLGQIRLPEGNLADADLTGADLTLTDLTGARLSKANLAGAALRGALLRGAFMVGAFMVGVDLSSALLTGTRGRHLADRRVSPTLT
jgi:uncharacterized protein YjbI with pentapeptide repeats